MAVLIWRKSSSHAASQYPRAATGDPQDLNLPCFSFMSIFVVIGNFKFVERVTQQEGGEVVVVVVVVREEGARSERSGGVDGRRGNTHDKNSQRMTNERQSNNLSATPTRRTRDRRPVTSGNELQGTSAAHPPLRVPCHMRRSYFKAVQLNRCGAHCSGIPRERTPRRARRGALSEARRGKGKQA
ncbi:hypothetical protein E2C01_043861 [Portunus trituberculatus]|uniref:Uncharacterized protein n=1 Tax=Portunus trituberculatus TaxID=210409 RepID=A0A5B7FYU4_PORTR|nr:hypothetical protein [Portunus trituberculatus]